MDSDTPKQFSDEQARNILARAIEIDSRAPMTSIDDLRAIASEIGVSPASLQAALLEQATARGIRRGIEARRATTVVATLGMPLGLGAGMLLTSGSILGTLGLSAVGIVATAALVVVQGAHATQRSYHFKSSMLWLGIAAGIVVSAALSSGEASRMPVIFALSWSLRGWIGSGILGSAAVIAIRRAQRSDDSAGGPDVTDASIAGHESRLSRVAKKVLAWIARPITRGDRIAAGQVGRVCRTSTFVPYFAR